MILFACRTNKYFVRKVRAAADSTCEHKVLMPYSPHAPRNRPKSTVSCPAVFQAWFEIEGTKVQGVLTCVLGQHTAVYYKAQVC